MPPSLAAHAPVASPSAPLPKRFFSANPSLGSFDHREKLDPLGHHKVPGFAIAAQPAAVPVPAVRPIRELTFGASAARGLMPAAKAAGASGMAVVPDPTKYPWRAIAVLKITLPGQGVPFYATGWFIGPYAVITAAHVVYPRIGSSGQWAAQIEVFPGLNGFDQPAPYSSFTSNTFFCPTAWTSGGDPSVDYGVILLSQGIGSTVGVFGYATYSDVDIRASLANLAGYPVVAPDGVSSQGHLWYDAGVAEVDDSFVYYQLDTRDGQSGTCVYRNLGDDSFVMAIHSGAFGATDRGVRIIQPVFENLQQWAAMQG